MRNKQVEFNPLLNNSYYTLKFEHIHCRCQDVAEAFMELVVDETKNGAVMRCSKQGGKQYCTINVTYK